MRQKAFDKLTSLSHKFEREGKTELAEFTQKLSIYRSSTADSKKPRIFYRGENPEITEKIKTGDDYWDSKFFVTDSLQKAHLYGHLITTVSAKSNAKILYEGTREFISVGKGIKKNRDLLEWGSAIVKKAEKKGYDAVWFIRQSDMGTVIINKDAFVIKKPED